MKYLTIPFDIVVILNNANVLQTQSQTDKKANTKIQYKYQIQNITAQKKNNNSSNF